MDTNAIDRLSRLLATGASRRRLVALAGGAAVAGVATTGFEEVAAQVVRNRSKNIPVSGATANGATKFTGRLNITRFTSDGQNLFAVGTLRGRLTRGGRAVPIRSRRVRFAVETINGVDVSSLTSAGAAGVAAQQVCTILTLTLGPLDLNLLGLRIQLNQINLRITAIPGGGLLGDLLCAVANLLSGGPVANLLGQLTRLLNRILGQLG